MLDTQRKPTLTIRTSRRLRILLVKPKPRLDAIVALHRFQMLEPIELGYLAAAVPTQHEVRVLDLRLERFADLAFRRVLYAWHPDLVGITGYTHEASLVKQLARDAREVLPKTKIVVGGHHATVAAADYDIPEIDAIVRGEGCAPFRRIVDALAHHHELAPIEGVLVPGSLTPYALHNWPSFPDPATMPVPRRDLWNARSYFSVWATEDAPMFSRLFVPASMVRTSFGCRMNCSFCIVPKLFHGEHRPRPVSAVAREIAALPTDHVYFCDDENFIDPDFAHALAEALERRGVRKRYFAWTRATTVNRFPDLFRRWRALGLDTAFLGFEFSTDEELRRSKKGSTVAENARAHDALRAEGIAVHAAFMLDPEFTEDDFARLHGYIEAMPPAQFSITICTPSPGTDDYEGIRERIWAPRPYDVHDCMHPLTPTKLSLRRFCKLYGRQIHQAGAKNPRRAARRAVHPGDMLRIAHAQSAYDRAFRNLYRDFPRELW
ncbi:MAG: radical SAM protein [Thermoanaerobaculia bacterium]